MSTSTWKHEAEGAANGMNREHHFQLALLDRLLSALDTRIPHPESLLGELLVTSDLHFATEEVLMRQHSHSRYHLHVEEHRQLMEALRELQRRFQAGQASDEDVVAMRRSIAAHIASADQDFENAVRGQA